MYVVQWRGNTQDTAKREREVHAFVRELEVYRSGV